MNVSLLVNIVNDLRDQILKKDLNQAVEFLDHDEWGLAFEFICDLIYGYKIPISQERYNKIEDYGKSIGISDKYWSPLQELIVKDS